MRWFTPLALVCALASPTAGQARPFSVDDLLRLEQLGPVQITPRGRWGIIQTFAPWERAPRFDLDWWSLYGLGRLQRVDLRSGAVRLLLRPRAGTGYVAGPLSPSGRRMAICRLTGHAWELGVVDLASGAVRWLGLSPELPLWGRTVGWRGDDQLLVIAQSASPIGHRLGYGWQGQARLGQAWAAGARGRLAVSVLGSGRYRALRPTATPKRLVLLGLSTGKRRVLATGDLIDLEIAPGGRRVAVLANGQDRQSETGPTNTGMAPQERRLLMVDLTRGAIAEPCPGCDVMEDLLAWSPKADRLLVFARTGDDWAKGGFQLIDVSSSSIQPIDLKGLTPVLPRKQDHGVWAAGAWLGETPVIYARPSSSERADWYEIAADGPKVLTAALASPSPRLLAVDTTSLTVADGSTLWRIYEDGGARRLAGAAQDVIRGGNAPEGERVQMTPPASQDLLVRSSAGLAALGAVEGSGVRLAADETPLAASAEVAIVVTSDARGAERLLLRRTGRPDHPLIALNTALDAVEPATVQAISHVGPEGQALTSWLYLPPGLAPGQRAPLVVIPYPGDDYASAPKGQAPGSPRLYANAQVLAGHGFAVLVPSLPFAKGREPIEGLADQVLAVVDAAAAQAPIDPTRIAVWGHSYGGYAALALATQSPRFKAIIGSAALGDLASNYASLAPYSYAVPESGLPVLAASGWAESGQARMQAPPWQAPERYRRNSPITFVDRIVAPVMLIYGDLDGDPKQPQEMFTSLYRQNKDAVLLIYRGESHVVISPANVRDEYARAIAFLDENIGPPTRLKP